MKLLVASAFRSAGRVVARHCCVSRAQDTSAPPLIKQINNGNWLPQQEAEALRDELYFDGRPGPGVWSEQQAWARCFLANNDHNVVSLRKYQLLRFLSTTRISRLTNIVQTGNSITIHSQFDITSRSARPQANPQNAIQRAKIPVRNAMTQVEKIKTPAILTAKMFRNE